MPDLEAILEETRAFVAPKIGTGKVADYIPALARVEPNKFGIAVVDLDGKVTSVGDAHDLFSIQSISKVFTLTLVLRRHGADLWKRVGREPSGSPFNSIVQLENERGIPRNPFINAGAIVVSDMLLGDGTAADTIVQITDFIGNLARDDTISVDREVVASEIETGFRNAALANFMRGFGNIKNPVDQVLEVYFCQCSIAMSCVQLARSALFLAAEGKDPASGEQIVSAQRARRINALMLSCGHYDASGDFAFRVGLPGKSGVGGGILAVVPNRCAIAVWSPGLNANGNSLVGTLALEHLAAKSGWSVFVG
ncbi:MAG: glutaminase [Hyphomicrobiaceae bacterium]|nr:glutaminase [Hyphomicrobiaceae bacterium]